MTIRRHRSSNVRILIAGDADELEIIEQELALVPDDACGQVFIETLDRRPKPQIHAPGRVTVTWLDRVTRPSGTRPLVFAARGEALAEALTAWMAEWMPGEPEAEGFEYSCWIGCPDNERVQAIAELLSERLPQVYDA